MNAKVKYLSDGRVDLTFENGDHYTGDLKGNKITGNGKMEYADGRIYEGHFTDDCWDGYGNAYFPSNKSRYTGYWKMNRREGRGTTTFYNDDGSVFAVHEADYHDDLIDGQLKSRFTKDGTTVEINQAKDYAAVSPVTIKYGPGYFDETLRGWTYSGLTTYENSWYVRNGEGILRSPEGITYSGTFKNNMRDGKFKVSYPDGRREVIMFNGVRETKISQYDPKDEAPKKIGMAGMKDRKPVENKPAETKPASFKNLFKPSEDTEAYLHVKYDGNSGFSKDLQPYFDGVIGMENVKDQLERMYKRFKIDALRKKQLGIDNGAQGYYFIISGNPGTGKTTVARIIGRMLHDLGILSGEEFVEVDRSGMVGQYIGQTAIKTSEVIQSARGGTLFIDEAYSLYRKDDEKDFGTEAIDTLLKDMEDHRGEYCCILAGYEDRMDEMIKNANPGLASRFDHKIKIDDYSPEELLDIIVTMAEKKHFYIKKEAEPVILGLFRKEMTKGNFANARFARKILDEALETQAMRLSDMIEQKGEQSIGPVDLQTLEASDFMEADGL